MKTYDVTMVCTVKKTYRVQAHDLADARWQAEDLFSLSDDDALESETDDCRIVNIWTND